MIKGFYDYHQNNSGGSFDVDDKVCHQVVVEAKSADEANEIAMDLGIYFDGCSEGMDCNCCGDRWDEADKPIDLVKLSNEGYRASVSEQSKGRKEAENRWYEKYGEYEVVKKPEWILSYSTSRYSSNTFDGLIKFHNLKSYLQFVANEDGIGTDNLIRIYYLNGNVKEIRRNK